jgi:hypothetical protein
MIRPHGKTPPEYNGPDRRAPGDLTVGDRLDRLEQKVDMLVTRVTILFGGLILTGFAIGPGRDLVSHILTIE